MVTFCKAQLTIGGSVLLILIMLHSFVMLFLMEALCPVMLLILMD